MQTARGKGGVRKVRLSAPEVRKFDDAAMLLRQLAVAIVDPDEIEHLNSTAKALDDVVADYTDNEEEKEAEEASPPFVQRVEPETLPEPQTRKTVKPGA